MRNIFAIITIAILVFTTSCVENSKKYKDMQSKLDSIESANEASKTEYDEAMQTLGEIENAMAQVRESEKLILMAREGDGNQVVSEIRALQDLIEQNKQKIASLESTLSASSKKNASLKTTITRLKSDLEEKDKLVGTLKDELAQRNIIINELNEQVTGLSTNIDSLTNISERQNNIIMTQDAAINTVWYCVGTSKELKNFGIVSGKTILPNGAGEYTNNSLMTSVDKREFDFLPLASKKVNILTTHPEGSFELVKGSDKTLTLKVIDKEEFWSVSRYLIISIK